MHTQTPISVSPPRPNPRADPPQHLELPAGGGVRAGGGMGGAVVHALLPGAPEHSGRVQEPPEVAAKQAGGGPQYIFVCYYQR